MIMMCLLIWKITLLNFLVLTAGCLGTFEIVGMNCLKCNLLRKIRFDFYPKKATLNSSNKRTLLRTCCQTSWTPFTTHAVRSIALLKVSKFQNEFMKSSFLPKYERKISALCSEGRNLDNFSFVFWEKR